MKVSHIFPMLGLALFCQCHEATAEGVPTTPQSPTETTDSATADASTKPLPKDATPTVYAGYRLIWNDEFNADGRPSDQWTYEQGFVRNQELQWYQPDNASVSNGVLVIVGRQQKVSNPDYDPQSTDWHYARPEAQFTSSCLTTQKSFHFCYGRMEVRARIPVTRGAWPAIWTLGNQGEWPQNGEIDLMEFYLKNGVRSMGCSSSVMAASAPSGWVSWPASRWSMRWRMPKAEVAGLAPKALCIFTTVIRSKRCRSCIPIPSKRFAASTARSISAPTTVSI